MKCPKCKTKGKLYVIDEEISEGQTHIRDDDVIDYTTYVSTKCSGIRASWIRCYACREEWHFERDVNNKLSIVGLRL